MDHRAQGGKGILFCGSTAQGFKVMIRYNCCLAVN